MNESLHKVRATKKSEHGSVKSYVTGFLLSLLFTAIPYYLVVNKIVNGNMLLSLILAIAVIQMSIQIFFFLHLGRGPKPLYNIAFFGGTVGIILVVVLGSIFIMDNLHYNMSPSEVTQKLSQDESIAQVGGAKTGACPALHLSHIVSITNGRLSSTHVQATLCDTLTFVNNDNVTREIAFGPHPQHLSYAGESDLGVRKSHNKTITLSQTGTYLFHDHDDPSIAGDFTVTATK